MSTGRSATKLELMTDALSMAFTAWIYPSDDEVRAAAAQTSSLAGVDYIASIANVMEQTNADANMARYLVATTYLNKIAKLLAEGESPRTGIMCGGNTPDDEETA